VDSTIANDLYHYLTGEGFKVFFAAITLEDKLGREYEPYIFAALQSAKVMLVLGTRPEYFSAVWVKNEWSRFLKLVKADRSRLIIPCYRDMDPYNLPEEFAHLQAQDMSKLGFVQDIVRGIKKVLGNKQQAQYTATAPVQSAQNDKVSTLLKRVNIFLEDGDWLSADEYCEKILDIDPECSEAYLGKLMAELEIRGKEAIVECRRPINGNGNYHKIIKYGSDELRREMAQYSAATIFNFALMLRAHAETPEDFRAAGEKFATVGHFKNARELADDCFQRANAMYQNGYGYQQQPLYGAPPPQYQQYNQGHDQLGNFFNRVEGEIRRVDNNLGTNFFNKK
jgi:tetratricopeptide (TPR) repeat protein